MEKIVVFLDYANINRTALDCGYALDYGRLLAYLSEGRFLVEAYGYIPLNPRNPFARDGEIEALWSQGYLVHSKTGAIAGDTYKCNFDVEITLELMRVAQQVHPDIIVLASGDQDFLPVVLALREQGIRVEVAAFPENAAREMALKCSGFIDLSLYCAQEDEADRADEETEAALADGDEAPNASYRLPPAVTVLPIRRITD